MAKFRDWVVEAGLDAYELLCFRYAGLQLDSDRIYPSNTIAKAIVWILDRFPVAIREEVLESYWSPEEIQKIKEMGAELEGLFGKMGEVDARLDKKLRELDPPYNTPVVDIEPTNTFTLRSDPMRDDWDRD